MTQPTAIAPQQEQLIAQKELEQYVDAQALAVAPETQDDSFLLLALGTQNILSHAKELASLKESLSKREYRKILKQHEWKSEDVKYLKVATAFQQFSHSDLAQIEPATIFRLANNPKKYQSVIDQLLDSSEITQATVRELIAKQRPSEEPKSEKPSIWRRTRSGKRYCQVPPIHETNEQTGTTLQKMMDAEGLTAQRIVAEAVSLRQAFIEGRLVLVEQTEQTSSEEELDTESAMQGSARLAAIDMTDITASHSDEEHAANITEMVPLNSAIDTTEVSAPSLHPNSVDTSNQINSDFNLDLVSVDNRDKTEIVPSVDFEHQETRNSDTTAPQHLNEEAARASTVCKSDPIDIQDSTASYPEVEDYYTDDGVEPIPGTWSYEPEPELDDSPIAYSPQQERSALELLLETIQVATTWLEIREALLIHEEMEPYVWEALTPTEKKRVMVLMPDEFKKLLEAKERGKIVNFKELRGGVYQIQCLGSVLPERYSSSRLENFLAQL